MPDVPIPISDLDPIGELAATDDVPVRRGGNTYRTTVQAIADKANTSATGVITEVIQDTVGSLIADSTTIDATYNDAGAVETLDVKNNTSTQKVVVAKAGVDVGTRAKINLIEGSNVTITAADSGGSDRVDVTIASTGGTGGGLTTEEVQDVVGALVTDSTTIDAAYNDAGGIETLDVKPNTSTQRVVVSRAGVDVGTRAKINFIQGSNVTLSATDNSGSDRVDVTIASSGGGGSSIFIRPEDFGAAGDKTTDDTAAIQAAVDSIYQNGMPGGTILFTGAYRITDTILVEHKGISLRGTSIGNTNDPAQGSAIIWDGASGIPMIKFLNCFNPGLESIRLVGNINSAKRPSAAVEFAATYLDPDGAVLKFIYVRDVWIGALFGYDATGGGGGGLQFERGIHFTGTTDADSNTFSHVVIFGCNVGIDNQNPNAAATNWNLVSISFCNIGIRTHAGFYGTVIGIFGSFECDIECSNGWVTINQFSGEGSRRWFRATGNSVKFIVRNSVWQAGTSTADPNPIPIDGVDSFGDSYSYFIDVQTYNNWTIDIDDFGLYASDLAPTSIVPKIRAHHPGGSIASGNLYIRNTRGMTARNLDLGSLVWSNDLRNVVFEPGMDQGGKPRSRVHWTGVYSDTESRTFRPTEHEQIGGMSLHGGPLRVRRAKLTDDVFTWSVAPTPTGSTTYTYKITAVTYGGETLAHSTTINNGPATLNSTNFITLTWHPAPGAYAYNIYGRSAGSEVLLKIFDPDSRDAAFGVMSWIDTGAAAVNSSTPPTKDTTGGALIEGKLTVGDIIVTTGSSVILADASSINTDASQGTVFKVQIAGNRTLENPTNMADGHTYRWRIKQDGFGSRTLAYGSKFKWPNNTPPTLSTTANSVDVISATYFSDTDTLYARADIGFTTPLTTLNPSTKSADITLSGGNLTATRTATGSGSYVLAYATVGRDTGDYFFTAQIGSPFTDLSVGLVKAGVALNYSGGAYPGSSDQADALMWWGGGWVQGGGVTAGVYTSYTSGNLVGIRKAGSTVTLYKWNGVSWTLVLASSTLNSGTWFPAVTFTTNTENATFNFGASAMTLPSGAIAWNG